MASNIVLLACGSFNPPTNMHLRMFELARDHLNRIGHQVLCGVISPVHDNYGKKELISSIHRCALIKLALQDNDWIHLSDWECNQEEWQRTRRVVEYHQNKINSFINELSTGKRHLDNEKTPSWISYLLNGGINSNKGVQVKLLCGADLLETFSVPNLWKDCDIESIIGEHGLAVITRNSSDPYKFVYESDILTKYQKNIIIIQEWITNDISSTKIRRSLRRGESVKYLVPNNVIEYIRNNSLYNAEENKYQLYPSTTSIYLSPSSNDVIMTSIDMPDGINYTKCTIETVDAKRPRPGQAVAIRKAVRPACLQ